MRDIHPKLLAKSAFYILTYVVGTAKVISIAIEISIKNTVIHLR